MAIRLSQLAIETLEAPLGKARLSQLAIETLEAPLGKARLSQLAIEVLKQRPISTFVGVSQVAIEVLVPSANRAWFTVQIV